MVININILREMGLAALAPQIARLFAARMQIGPSLAREVIALADAEMNSVRNRLIAGVLTPEMCHRAQYLIVCGIHVLVDEFPVTKAAKEIFYEFLCRPDRVLPPYLDGILPNGCTITCRMSDYVQFMAWFYGVYEPAESYIFNALVKPEMIVVDAGANFGQYTLLAATSVGALGHVHCFEPYPGNMDSLLLNVQRNGLSDRCSTNCCALWSRDGSLSLSPPAPEHLRTYKTNNGAYRVSENLPGPSSSSSEVGCITLDSYVERESIEKIDFIKIDVEGAELDVLSGARNTLMQWKPLILMEVNETALAWHGRTSSELFTLMTSLGYQWSPIGDVPSSGSQSMHENFIFYSGQPPAQVKKKHHPADPIRWATSGYSRPYPRIA